MWLACRQVVCREAEMAPANTHSARSREHCDQIRTPKIYPEMVFRSVHEAVCLHNRASLEALEESFELRLFCYLVGGLRCSNPCVRNKCGRISSI